MAGLQMVEYCTSEPRDAACADAGRGNRFFIPLAKDKRAVTWQRSRKRLLPWCMTSSFGAAVRNTAKFRRCNRPVMTVWLLLVAVKSGCLLQTLSQSLSDVLGLRTCARYSRTLPQHPSSRHFVKQSSKLCHSAGALAAPDTCDLRQIGWT